MTIRRRHVRLALPWCGAALLLALSAPGSAVEITVRTVLEDTEPNARVQGLLQAEADGEHKLEEPFTSGLEARLDLLPRLAWKVRASAEGYWSPEEIVVPADRAEPVTITLHPIGAVTGTLAIAGHDKLPEDLQVLTRFRSAEPVKRNAQGLEGTVDCTVRNAEGGKVPDLKSAPHLECRVPAGKLNLRIRASGYVSHYFWDRTLAPGEELDLGKLELRPGASVVGWVETSDEAPVTDCEVELVPQLVDSPSSAESARASILTLGETVDERGFFHFVGIVPGSYVVTARLEGYSPAIVENLVVLENAEAELEDPLILERPLDLTVLVRPTSDPSGRRWGVMLIPSAGGRPRPVHRPPVGFTDSEGAWTGERLRSGEYLLMLMDSRGSRLKTEYLDLAADQTTFIVEVPFVEVTGKVTLGDEPFQAKVFIGGVSGAVSISADSDEEGLYSAVIPEREETWEVDVTAKAPRIFSRMRDVEIKADASGEARLDIELPDTNLDGTVVDEEGREVAEANVIALSVSASTKPAFIKTDDEGEFSFRGQPYGTYWLEARAMVDEESLRSPTVETFLSKTNPSAKTRLVVRRDKQVRGTVFSPVGGVPGAKVRAVLPRTTGPWPMIDPETRTGGDGRFSLDLSAETDRFDLLIMAPGFVFRKLPVELAEAAELDIAVSQEGGGTLTIGLKKPWPSFEFHDRRPYVVLSDGTKLDLSTLSLWASMNGVYPEDEPVLSVPLLPSDAYTVCFPVEGTKRETACKSGFLPSGGGLVLNDQM